MSPASPPVFRVSSHDRQKYAGSDDALHGKWTPNVFTSSQCFALRVIMKKLSTHDRVRTFVLPSMIIIPQHKEQAHDVKALEAWEQAKEKHENDNIGSSSTEPGAVMIS